MSQQYDNTDRGALFKNEGDRKRENGPEYSGNLNVGGVEFYLDAWLKKSASGKTFMSVKVKPKQERTHGQMQADKRKGYGQDDDSDLPF